MWIDKGHMRLREKRERRERVKKANGRKGQRSGGRIEKEEKRYCRGIEKKR